MNPNSNQIDIAIDTLSDGTEQKAPEANQPQVPFPGSLVLTRDQEDKLVDHAITRLDQLMEEQGRNVNGTTSYQVPRPDKNTFLGRREIYALRYQSYVEDRQTGAGPENPGNIFDVSNLTVGLSQRITMQMAARANAYFFGTDPWFTVAFVGTQNQPLAERIDKHAHWKFGESDLKSIGKKAVEYAFVRGESVLKTTYLDNTRYYQRKGKVMVSEGKPVFDLNGNYIFDDAKWVPQMAMMPVAPAPVAQPGDPNQILPGSAPDAASPIDPTGEGPQMTVQATGKQVLKRDGVTVQPPSVTWAEGVWPLKRKIYQGTNCELVYYKDFICPLDAEDIHKADLIAHLFDIPVMDLVEMFKAQAYATMDSKAATDSITKAVETLKALAGETDMPKAAARQARTESGEQFTRGDDDSPSAEVAEIYLRYDANEDGLAEEIMLVVDRRNRIPVFYDFTDNVTVNGRRPFEVIRPKPVDGRWYGIGAIEYFQHEQEFIDLSINRRNFEQSASGRVTFWRPSKTKEGQSQPGLKMHHGRTYTPVDDAKAEEILQYVTLPDTSEGLMEMIQFFMQIAQLKSGMANSADGQMSGLPQPKTATGINDLSSSGDEMFSQFLDELEPGLEKSVKANLRVTYANFNEAEYFYFSKGDVQIMDQLLPDDVADLDFDVSLLMTRKHTEQRGLILKQAHDILTAYYQSTPPVQERMAKNTEDVLKNMGIEDPDIRPMTWAEFQPPMPAAPPGQPAQPAPALI